MTTLDDVAFPLEVCVDCYSELGGVLENPDPAWDRSAFDRAREGYGDITYGHFAEQVHPGEECDEDTECGQITYSKSPCELCGSSLHGAREVVTGWKSERREIFC
ncbi:hypothetical protein MUG78_16750 [Gordonia alkaliphila]|uniref:hypothetical protein n=1 Tax=Gordonia alkaliphila TaxID=1053547 RepID=UPI001FF18F88|nr:hypothetical protein [Gordonia alkaliphila]MCK0441051.1 hypothetical protein [Gordonia alkaliphila]